MINSNHVTNENMASLYHPLTSRTNNPRHAKATSKPQNKLLREYVNMSIIIFLQSLACLRLKAIDCFLGNGGIKGRCEPVELIQWGPSTAGYKIR